MKVVGIDQSPAQAGGHSICGILLILRMGLADRLDWWMRCFSRNQEVVEKPASLSYVICLFITVASTSQ